MTNNTESTPLTASENIQSAISQLRDDKDIFDKFEIDSKYIERYIGKYRSVDGNTKVFDYWYNEFTKIKSQVENINAIIENYKTAFHDQFKNCSSCANEIKKSFKKFTNYEISQIRANIDLLNLKTTLMILFKTCDNLLPESKSDYDDFLKSLYDTQEKCNDNFKPNNYTFKTLLHNDEVSANLLQRDFPISIRM